MDKATFCIYCQRRFTTRRGFEKHIETKHPDTYASESLRASRI